MTETIGFEGGMSNPDPDYPTDESDQVEPEVDTSEVQPVAVYIVDQEEEKSAVGWNGRSVFVDATHPAQLAGRDVNRKRLVVLNAGADTVYLDNSAVMNTGFSFALPINTSIELLHNDHVFAQCASGDTATVSVVSEFVTDSISDYA